MKKIILSLLMMLSFYPQAVQAKDIRVALLFKFSDKFNGEAKAFYDGIEVAKTIFEKENPEHKITIKQFDHVDSMLSLAKQVKQIKKEKFKIIIGPERSDEVIAVTKFIKDTDIVLISSTASNPTISKFHKNTFSTCFSDKAVSAAMIKYLVKEYKPKKVGVFHNVSYPYTDFLSIQSKKNLAGLGVKSITYETAKGMDEHKKLAEKAKSDGVKHMILFSYQSDLMKFHIAATKIGLSPVYVGSDGWGRSDWIYKKAIERFKEGKEFVGYRSFYWYEGFKTKHNSEFKRLFKERFKKNADAFGAMAFDTAMVVFQASAGKGKLADNLRTMTFKDLLTTNELEFNGINFPKQKEIFIYKIDKKGPKYIGVEVGKDRS